MRRNNPFTRWLALGISCGVVVAGCSSSGGYGESIRFGAQAQSRVDEVLSTGERLVIPRDAKFSIVESQRSSEGGGASESHADGSGKASCSATLDGIGVAAADFQLGHMLFNAEDTPRDVTVTIDCAYQYETSGSESGKVVPEMVGLKFYIKNSKRAVLCKEALVAPEGALGAQRNEGRQATSFNITIEPGLAYQLVLAGRVALRMEEAQPAMRAGIEVKQLQITIADRWSHHSSFSSVTHPGPGA